MVPGRFIRPPFCNFCFLSLENADSLTFWRWRCQFIQRPYLFLFFCGLLHFTFGGDFFVTCDSFFRELPSRLFSFRSLPGRNMGGGRGSMEPRVLLWYHIEVDQTDEVRNTSTRAARARDPPSRDVFYSDAKRFRE